MLFVVVVVARAVEEATSNLEPPHQEASFVTYLQEEQVRHHPSFDEEEELPLLALPAFQLELDHPQLVLTHWNLLPYLAVTSFHLEEETVEEDHPLVNLVVAFVVVPNLSWANLVAAYLGV